MVTSRGRGGRRVIHLGTAHSRSRCGPAVRPADTVTGDGGVDLIMGQGNDTLGGAGQQRPAVWGDGRDLLSGGVGAKTPSSGGVKTTCSTAATTASTCSTVAPARTPSPAGPGTSSGGVKTTCSTATTASTCSTVATAKTPLSGGAGNDTLIGAGHDDLRSVGRRRPFQRRSRQRPDYTVAEGDTTDGTIP